MSRRNYLSNDFARNMWDDLFSNTFWPMSTRKTETMMKTDIKEDENGYSVKDGYRDFIDEIIESQDSYWDNYQEFGNNI